MKAKRCTAFDGLRDPMQSTSAVNCGHPGDGEPSDDDDDFTLPSG